MNNNAEISLFLLVGIVIVLIVVVSGVSQFFLWRAVHSYRTQDVNFDLVLDCSLATASAAVILVDEHGNIEKANHMCYRVTGWPDTLAGQHLNVLMPPRFQAAHARHREKYMNNPRVRQMGVGRELFLIHHDGTEIPVEIGLSPLTKADGSKHVLAYITPRSPSDSEVDPEFHS